MPNPLTMAISSPTATKPGANAQEQRDQNGAASFQMVMDQDADQQPDALEPPEPQVQEPEIRSDIEDAAEEVQAADITEVLDNQPFADLQGVAPEATPEAPLGVQAALPQPPPAPIDSESEPYRDIRSEIPRVENRTSSKKPEQRAVPPVLQSSGPVQASPQQSVKTIAKPQHSLEVPPAVEPRQKEKPDPLAPFGPGRDTSETPPAPDMRTQQPTVPVRAPSFVQMQLLASNKASSQIESHSSPDVEDVGSVKEAQGFAPIRESGPNLQTLTAAARAETTRVIAGQVATAINARPQSGAIEIALNPEELGRVSIVLNGRDDGLHMTIAAERPETLDMMRRHLSVLEAEFRNLGLGDLSFDLGTSSDAPQDEPDGKSGSTFSTPQPEHTAETGPAFPQMAPDGRIDMRL